MSVITLDLLKVSDGSKSCQFRPCCNDLQNRVATRFNRLMEANRICIFILATSFNSE